MPDALRTAVSAVRDLRGNDIMVLDVRGIHDATDFFIIASGTSDAHVRGLAHTVMAALEKEGLSTHHVEGLEAGRWVLIDFFDFVVHLFHPETRRFYQLERLWNDAPILKTGTT